MQVIRVFPRNTAMTPNDSEVRINSTPTFFDEADEVHISVAFSWDMGRAEVLAKQWQYVAPVKMGGPAFKEKSENFTPGFYLKTGNLITSRGCPNHCWFCDVWKVEGPPREYPVRNGWNILDDNLLACSRKHQTEVFRMLRGQRKVRFTGGLDPARFTPWHAEWFRELSIEYAYFAYDTPDDLEPLANSADILRDAGLLRGHKYGCYVLVGAKPDTFSSAERRLKLVMDLGFMPQAMLYNKGMGFEGTERTHWKQFAREWANKIIVGKKMGKK